MTLNTLDAQSEALAAIAHNIEGKMKSLAGMIERDKERVRQQEKQLEQYQQALAGIMLARGRVSEDIALSRLSVFPKPSEG